MKMPPALDAMLVKFDRLSLRERLMIFAAILAGVIGVWQMGLMSPLERREKLLSQELSDLQERVSLAANATESASRSDPTSAAMRRLAERQKALDAINAKLAAESAGLVPPAQMVEVIHDVLRHQRGVRLLSLKNLEVITLAPPEVKKPDGATDAAANPDGDTGSAPKESVPANPVDDGPYLHPVELVVEGRYLDVVTYLRELEALPYHFYWRVLELETKAYPLNRVRIELSTVSLDKEWIGV